MIYRLDIESMDSFNLQLLFLLVGRIAKKKRICFQIPDKHSNLLHNFFKKMKLKTKTYIPFVYSSIHWFWMINIIIKFN